MKIVIVGGGFAGVNLIKELSKDKSIEIVLVDVNNYNFFPPLIYQVATSFLEASNISYPFRKMFQEKRNVGFHYGSLQKVDIENKWIETDNGQISYDKLVLALGTQTNYYGMENVKENALSMKTIDDALNLRNHLLLNMELAARLKTREERLPYLNIVIAGGGPTGVELAGMLGEMSKVILRKEYPEFADPHGKIFLIDAAPTLLGPMSKKSQAEAEKQIKKFDVEILFNTAVKDYIDNKVLLANGEMIPTHTLIWTSGVIAREVVGLPSSSIGKGRRIMVNDFNEVIGVKNVFAIGDICLQTSDKAFPNGHPQLAQVAIQQGILLSKNLKKLNKNHSLIPFQYNDKGSMAIISKFKAVVDLPNGFIKGFLAWFTWLFIHIIPLVGYRNKLKTASNWFWSFISNETALRLIIRPKEK
jgi:NADH dehydrogenase